MTQRILDIDTDKKKIYSAATDVNSELFKQLQRDNHLQFEKVVNEYAVYDHRGRKKFYITDQRKKEMRAIDIVDERPDKDGNPVIRWDLAIEEQRRLLQRFESLDSRSY
jgi:hypothetical protein